MQPKIDYKQAEHHNYRLRHKRGVDDPETQRSVQIENGVTIHDDLDIEEDEGLQGNNEDTNEVHIEIFDDTKATDRTTFRNEIITDEGAEFLIKKGSITEWIKDYQEEFTNELKLSSFKLKQESDDFISPIKRYLRDGSLPTYRRQANQVQSMSDQYALIDDLLYRVTWFVDSAEGSEYKLAVPRSLVATVIRCLHSDVSGHFGLFKTLFSAKRYFHWRNMGNSIAKFIGNCKTCLAFKRSQHRMRLPLLKFHRPTFPFQSISLDLTGPLQLSSCKRYRYIALCVDRYSRFLVTFPLRTKSQNEFLSAFHANVLCVHGIPSNIYSDRGPEFLNAGMRALCSSYGINQQFTSGYSASFNGLVERRVSDVLNVLRTSVHLAAKSWAEMLPQITFNINTTVCKATGYSSFYIVYGRLPKSLSLLHNIDYAMNTKDPMFSQIVQNQTLTQQIVLDYASDFEDITRQAVNAHRPKTSEAQIGDFVYLFKPPAAGVDNQKLKAIYTGPFVIVDVLPRGNVMLKNATTLRTYPYPVHMSRLKLAKYLKDV